MFGMVMVLMWKPVAHSLSFTFSSSILGKLESHIIPTLLVEMHENKEKSTRLVRLFVEG
jgi:hypothetical protein